VPKLIALLFCIPALAADFFPVSVWYGGGKARAPMLEKDARAKKELWRKDIRQIKALGFNTVRTWIDWATGEPREREYRFENLDVVLELAQEEGLKVFCRSTWIRRRGGLARSIRIRSSSRRTARR
jgi:beta-galactosidase